MHTQTLQPILQHVTEAYTSAQTYTSTSPHTHTDVYELFSVHVNFKVKPSVSTLKGRGETSDVSISSSQLFRATKNKVKLLNCRNVHKYIEIPLILTTTSEYCINESIQEILLNIVFSHPSSLTGMGQSVSPPLRTRLKCRLSCSPSGQTIKTLNFIWCHHQVKLSVSRSRQNICNTPQPQQYFVFKAMLYILTRMVNMVNIIPVLHQHVHNA